MIGCKPLTEAELECFFEHLNAKYHLLARTGFVTGYRISELLRATSEDIDKQTRSITLGILKTRSEKRTRTVQLPDAEYQALKSLKQGRLFDFSRSGVQKAFRRAFRACGMREKRRYGTHSMRKTFAQAVYTASDRRIEVLRLALAHKSLQTTVSYIESLEDYQAAVRQAHMVELPSILRR